MSAGTPIVTVPRPGAAVVHRWQPARAIHEYSEDARNRAAASRAAFQPELERYGHLPAIPGQCSRAVQQKLHLSERWVRQRWNLYIGRDRGFNEWHRHDLYLDDSPPLPPPKTIRQYDHSDLGHRLVFANPARPTLTERQHAISYAFQHFHALAANFPDDRSNVKQSTLHFLWQTAPSLARSFKALARTWNRQHAKWKDNGQKPSAIADLRAVNSGNHFDWSTIEPDLQLLVGGIRDVERDCPGAYHFDGKISIAYRRLRRAGLLSQIFTDRYTLDLRRNKSYVAKSIRKEIKARLAGMIGRRRGPRAVRDQAPFIQRDHSGYEPGDWFAADDVTFNSYWWYEDDHGRPAVTRGECLMFFDCRSLYPLSYVLVPGRYHGETVRRGLCHMHDVHGLPHKGLNLERGIFASKIVAGKNRSGFLGWDEYEMGLREHGLNVELRNVTTPGAKLIEGVFNILQQNQRDLPGFVGFNEREYKQERLQKIIGRVQRGLEHPDKTFLSHAQFCEALDQRLEAYMHEPQNGQLLRGKSPAEMFALHRPLRKLAPDQRYLLASHRVRATVKTNGLAITIRGQRRFFYDENLGEYVGREVLAWYNIEEPDLLTVSDMQRKTFFSVKRRVVDAWNATNEELAQVNRERRAFMAPAKMRVDAIQHPVRASIARDNILDPYQSALGAHIRQETARYEHEQSGQKRKLAQAVLLADAAGIELPENPRHLDSVLEGINLLSGASKLPRPAGDCIPAPLYCDSVQPGESRTKSGHPPTVNLYWARWTKLEKIKRCKPELRHALTQKTIGNNPTVNAMSPAQLVKMIDCFDAIIRDAQAAPTP